MLLGVQIGLETHRRKNVGGSRFRDLTRAVLLQAAAKVGEQTGHVVEILEEERVQYSQRLSKRLDFVVSVNGTTRFGVETNFYTVPGSKPTEIKRSYGQLERQLARIGLQLIWITDGKGYRKMARSLRDAYTILPNIYNLNQAAEFLPADLRAAIEA